VRPNSIFFIDGITSINAKFEKIIEKVHNTCECNGYFDRKKNRKYRVSIVPNPKPEKKVSNEVTRAARQSIRISIDCMRVL
jgi:hypothetical protein